MLVLSFLCYSWLYIGLVIFHKVEPTEEEVAETAVADPGFGLYLHVISLLLNEITQRV
jgi:hypothetical protein